MVARGVNGASVATLNERFIKCEGCRVNIPKEDMLSLGKCTVCGRAFVPEQVTVEGEDGSDGGVVAIARTVAFEDAAQADASDGHATGEAKKKTKKRWVTLTSKRGRTYYHNTESGEDTWVQPPDIDADAADDQFVPFKNDAVKNAVLREQAKSEATKRGVPATLIDSLQQKEKEADDPFAGMLRRPTPGAGGDAAQAGTASAPSPAPITASAVPRQQTQQQQQQTQPLDTDDSAHSMADAAEDDGASSDKGCSVM